jgi:hypothetical protein
MAKMDTTTDYNDDPSTPTSSPSEFRIVDFDSIVKQAKEGKFGPWKAEITSNGKVKFEFFDNIHCLPKYSLEVDNSLEISVLVYNWPLSKNHGVYQEFRQTVRYADISELLEVVEKSSLCNGLPQDDDDVQPLVIDPTSQCSLGSGTVLRHSLPKLPCDSDTHFEVTVFFRSVDCELIAPTDEEQCKPCSSAVTKIKKASRRKSRSSKLPAKPKAPLAACGPEKLRATLKATRLECKELEGRLQNLERNIEKNGLGISESTEKDILKIMAGKNLEENPHMKFFWEQQMKLL